MAVTDEEIKLSKELEVIGEDLTGVKEVKNAYGTMPSENYKLFILADRDNLDTLIEQIQYIKKHLPENEGEKNQFVMMVNNAQQNPVVYMDDSMKDTVIDGFKATIPKLIKDLEIAFEAKKAELEVANG